MAESEEGRARPPFSPSIALVTASRIVEVRLAALLAPHGLNLRKYGVLGHIAASPGLSLSDLARRSRITVQSVHALIGTLSEAGLVSSRTETNGLPAHVSVTEEGRRVLDRIRDEVATFDRETFEGDGWRDVSVALSSLFELRSPDL